MEYIGQRIRCRLVKIKIIIFIKQKYFMILDFIQILLISRVKVLLTLSTK